MSLDFFEEFYHQSILNTGTSFPEGYLNIAEILSHPHCTDANADFLCSQSDNDFIIAESKDKLTLFNADFAIWLVPELVQGQAVTRGYIAVSQGEGNYEPEMAFEASGQYNQSSLILEALQLYLKDIKDTENALRSFRFNNDH
ncbi:conserved hypothetical protein [Chlamydia pneumoniae LPCoLN]|uniref:hypothetical protein n=1 Tax=Chlamydia pneumoniae TaxID=83558 RepID=UPI0001BD9D9E|nr:hypothetical protein [Chlamydia pneumoniae]ACZ32555.1 conserved hypothetical protein [Chlamydia pneumoniae LPCoLN]ETR80580.1 hypothetical protein X556_0090 [Chlamydia pneumoniae B21]